MADRVWEQQNGQPTILETWYGKGGVWKMSYSLAADVDKCGHYVSLKRVQGYAPIIVNAAMEMGNCVEAGVVAFFKLNRDPIKAFTEQWAKAKDNKTYSYGDKGDSWMSYNAVGRELMKQVQERHAELPLNRLPLSKMTFGEELQIKNWRNGTPLQYIADAYYRDAADPLGGHLTDIKCSGKSYPSEAEYPNLAALDPQLLVGALVSGIRRVSFLHLVRSKNNPKLQVSSGIVTDELIADIEAWLVEQYEKIVARKFHRRTGTRWPNDGCVMCDMLPICSMQGEAEIAKTLVKKSNYATTNALSALDELD
jgi:hypothetical protein